MKTKIEEKRMAVGASIRQVNAQVLQLRAELQNAEHGLASLLGRQDALNEVLALIPDTEVSV